ncbi:MAG: hypothetical protein LBH05_03680 [Deferribacteraceae bacterium]|jgi:methionyl-tRNA formyltransferase|nr:hypothetical protein [Deferribacteraceae bacterium]
MKRRLLLFTQGFAGELLCNALKERGITPVIYTYALNATRRISDQAYLREGYPYKYIHERSFDSSKVNVRSGDLIICAEWTKDFFHNTDPGAPVYHLHFSLLPRYRGYGAVSEQFLRGVSLAGVTLYRENGHIDAGPVAYQCEIRIEHDHTTEEYIRACVKEAQVWISELADGAEPELKAQDETDGFYVQRRRRHTGMLDLNACALYVYNTVRAYSKPYFGSYFYHNGKKITVWNAKCDKWAGMQGRPGEILGQTHHGVEIACGEGSVVLTEAEINGTVYKFDEITNCFNV